MGKEIVYCHGCGKRLFEDDFARGRAHTLAYQHFCADCKPLPPSPSTAGTRLRAPVPMPGPAKENRVLPRAWAPSRSTASFIGGAIAGGMALIGLVIAVASKPDGGSQAPPPFSPPPPAARPAGKPAPEVAPAPDRDASAAAALRELEAFARTQPEPEALLLKCDQLRSVIRGTPQEARFRQIEERAAEIRRARLEAARIDDWLAQADDLRRGDPGFTRRADVVALLKAAASVAGARRAEVERRLAEYESAFAQAAEREFARLREEALAHAACGRFAEALARCDDFPEPYRREPYGARVEALRAELERRAAEAARIERERRAAVWKAWSVTSSSEEDSGRLHDRHLGRDNVLKTHPLDRDTPAALEGAVDLPAGKRTVLEFWVAPHEQGDWELRVLVDGKTVEKRLVGPKGSGWRRVRVDLSSHAGRRVRIRLENAANDWAWEYGYWCDLEFKEAPGLEEIVLPADAARRAGSIQLQRDDAGPFLAGWFQDGSAEWSAEVPRAGEYSVEFTYALAPNNGGDFEVIAGKERILARTVNTGGWEDFSTRTIGKLALPAGAVTLGVRPVRINGGLMNLREARLVRIR